MTIETTNVMGATGEQAVAIRACQSCARLTEELSAAMDRIVTLIVDRDAARALLGSWVP